MAQRVGKIGGIGYVIEAKVQQRAKKMLRAAGTNSAMFLDKKSGKKYKRTLDEMSPTQLRETFSRKGLVMRFNQNSWPDELKMLGIEPIPGFNYWGDLTQLNDPKLLKRARPILVQNQMAVANLHTNPNLQRVLGRDLAVDEKVARDWYPAGSVSMVEDWGTTPTIGGIIRGRGSAGTGYEVESRSGEQLLSNPRDMFAVGNMNTERTVDSLIGDQDYVNDPSVWGGQEEAAKTYNYAMNYVDPLNPNYVTNDIHQVALTTGLNKASGIGPDPIFNNTELYNLWSGITKEVADTMGMRPNEAQSLMWSIWRDLMSGDVTGTGMGTRPITIAESVSKAIEGKPKGLLDDMARAARTHERRQLAALDKQKPGPKTDKAIEAAKKRGQRRFDKAKKLADKYGVKLDPRLAGLIGLTTAGAIGGGYLMDNLMDSQDQGVAPQDTALDFLRSPILRSPTKA